MTRKPQSGSARTAVTRRTIAAGLGAVGFTAAFAPFNILRAQGGALKVGVLLPRSGVQAGIGQDCQRGVEVAPGILKSLGLPELQIMNGDTESNPQIARAQAEKLINEGAQLLVGAFDSGRGGHPVDLEQPGDPLRVVLVHLATERADEVALPGPGGETTGRLTQPRIGKQDCLGHVSVSGRSRWPGTPGSR